MNQQKVKPMLNLAATNSKKCVLYMRIFSSLNLVVQSWGGEYYIHNYGINYQKLLLNTSEYLAYLNNTLEDKTFFLDKDFGSFITMNKLMLQKEVLL